MACGEKLAYGYRRVAWWLQRKKGLPVNRKRVLRVMRERGLLVRARRLRAPRKKEWGRVEGSAPNQIWQSDIRVRPRIVHETTTQGEALDVVSHDGVAALTTPAAQYPPNDRIVFRKFNDEILFTQTSLAYFGEPTSPILKSLRGFLSEAFQPLAAGPFLPEGDKRQMILF